MSIPSISLKVPPHFFLSQNLLGSASISEGAHLEVGGGASCPVCPPVVTPLPMVPELTSLDHILTPPGRAKVKKIAI